jgi:hypothetical protein
MFAQRKISKNLTVSDDLSQRRSKISNSSNASKLSLHFKTVTREKNQKRAYLDWNNKPMLLINQNEIEPRMIESHQVLPKSKFITFESLNETNSKVNLNGIQVKFNFFRND